MAIDLAEHLFSRLGELRYVPTAKRIRALVAGEPVADTRAALLVWQPKRVVPLYAVPEADLRGELVPGETAAAGRAGDGGMLGARPVLAVGDFHLHGTPGEELVLRAGDRAIAAFRPEDPALAGYVILDFDGLDTWLEEDEEVVAHPRDPFHRVDVRRSTRHVRIERDGVVLADTTAPRLVFETHLPTRYYLPREDVREDLLRPSDTQTACAYKGGATYYSAVIGDRVVPDLAWVYEDPLPDAAELRGLVAFFDERVDLTVDGDRRERPVTPWSRAD